MVAAPGARADISPLLYGMATVLSDECHSTPSSVAPPDVAV